MSAASAINTTCPYCGVGCGVTAFRQAGPDNSCLTLNAVRGDESHPANQGKLCVKGSALATTLGSQGRLLHPRLHGCRTDWDTALDVVASGFRRIIAEHGPDAVAFYLSGQLLTEDYYVANKLMKGFIGSANVDTNSRLCMSSAVASYKRAFGADIVPCSYEDLEICDLLLITGSNAAWTHPVLFQRIRAAKQKRPEMKIVVIDPRRTATCEIADLHLALAPGSDAFLFTGLLAYLDQHQRLDETYIQNHTRDFAQAVADCPDIETVATATELDESVLIQFFRWFADTDKTVTFYSQGINQSATGTDKGNAIINCHLATGRIGKPGMGPFSITGQPNAMGGREVGGLANQLAAHMDFSAENIDRVSRFWQAPTIARNPGLNAVALFDAIASGKIKAIWIMATNPLVSLPESSRMHQALQACELVVVSDCIEDTDTSPYAHVLLPAAGWAEKDGTVTNSERCISRQRQLIPPPGEAQPDWWIVTQVAKRLGYTDAFHYTCPADIFREHAALSGFENTLEQNALRAFNIGGLAELSNAEYACLQPLRWPVSGQDYHCTETLLADGRFYTPDQRARFVPVQATLPKPRELDRYPWLLNTGRLRDQWHTMTRTGRAEKLMLHSPFPFVALSTRDALSTGIREGDLVRIHNQHGELLLQARIDPAQRNGELFIPIHWTQQFASAAVVNTLISSIVDPVSGQPESKYAGVQIQHLAVDQWLLCVSTTPVDVTAFPYWARIPLTAGWAYLLALAAGTDTDADPIQWVRNWLHELGISGEKIEFFDSRQGRLHCIITEQDKLGFGLFTSREPGSLPGPGFMQTILQHQPGPDSWRLVSQQHDDASNSRIICSCLQVQQSAIIDSIQAGARTVTALGRQLRCGTNCGSCVPELVELLRIHSNG
ncbi:MAG: molybdopterin-dependent oxidoreductase [Pseudomonadales bacterium]|nr:molybdopterin-dependent oxidoreductase [Pseudomonadales bacterium]